MNLLIWFVVGAMVGWAVPRAILRVAEWRDRRDTARVVEKMREQSEFHERVCSIIRFQIGYSISSGELSEEFSARDKLIEEIKDHLITRGVAPRTIGNIDANMLTLQRRLDALEARLPPYTPPVRGTYPPAPMWGGLVQPGGTPPMPPGFSAGTGGQPR